jgi:hypothetical protein
MGLIGMVRQGVGSSADHDSGQVSKGFGDTVAWPLWGLWGLIYFLNLCSSETKECRGRDEVRESGDKLYGVT